MSRSDRIFKVDFYPHEWLTQTGHLQAHELGIYITIIMLIYARRGPIMNDSKHISRAAGCSPRLVSSTVQKLLEHGELSLVDNMLMNKRCEHELNHKRNLSEKGANGARKSNEIQRELRKNNDLFDSYHPSTSYNNITPTSNNPPHASKGVLKNGSGEGIANFDISQHLDDKAYAKAKIEADGWDIYSLMQRYNENIRSGRMPPPRDAKRAFPAWCKSYTKGKPPA